MAEETTVALKIVIDGQERAVNNLKELKQARKDATDAFLKGDKDAAKSLAQLTDKMEDLKDASKSVKGEGLEPLRSSFRLFGEGMKDLDFGKLGQAFKGLGLAMKAVPIFLLVEGITYLITNFKELTEGTGILATVLKPLGDLFNWLKDGLYALTDAIGLTNSELDKMGESVKTNAEKSKEAIAQQNAEYDRQIAVAKAAGKSTIELEQAKQQAIIDTNVQIVKQIEAFVRAGGVLDEEKQKLLTASLEGIKNARTQQAVVEITHNKELIDKYKEHLAEKQKADSLRFEQKKSDNQAEIDMQTEMLATMDALNEEQAQKDRDRQAALDAEKLNMSLWHFETEQTQKEKLDKIDEENAAKEKARRQDQFNTQMDLAQKSTQTLMAFSDLYFSHQLRQAKGNAEREREIKKKQFNMNKAFGITTAVIDGVRSVQAALTQTPPLSYVLAALNAALAIANVAKIASAKFDDGGSSASGGGADIGGSVSGASAPAIPQPNNQVTKLDEEGNLQKAKEQPVVKAVVVETDITDKQKRVNTIEESAKL